MSGTSVKDFVGEARTLAFSGDVGRLSSLLDRTGMSPDVADGTLFVSAIRGRKEAVVHLLKERGGHIVPERKERFLWGSEANSPKVKNPVFLSLCKEGCCGLDFAYFRIYGGDMYGKDVERGCVVLAKNMNHSALSKLAEFDDARFPKDVLKRIYPSSQEFYEFMIREMKVTPDASFWRFLAEKKDVATMDTVTRLIRPRKPTATVIVNAAAEEMWAEGVERGLSFGGVMTKDRCDSVFYVKGSFDSNYPLMEKMVSAGLLPKTETVGKMSPMNRALVESRLILAKTPRAGMNQRKTV